MIRHIKLHHIITALCVIALTLLFNSQDALAQSLTIDLSQGGSRDGTFTSRIIQLIAITTVLSLAPSILVMMTSFTRIIVVFSLLRSAVGIQQTPPNMVLVSLALFMTFFIMSPTLEKSYEMGIGPLMEERMDEMEALTLAIQPIKEFMLKHTREEDLQLFLSVGGREMPNNLMDTPMHVLIPAFMISELRVAFQIGFLLFLPFLIIDMTTASVLMSMGMMMLPPILISLPFKIIFFVVVDGWYLIAGSLMQSYGLEVLNVGPLSGGEAGAAAPPAVTTPIAP